MGLVTNCSSIVWASQMGLRKPLTFWSKRSEVETSFRAVQQWHCTSQAALWKAGIMQLKTQRGSCGKASRAGFAAGTWLWYWLVCAAHQNGLAEVYTKVYSCQDWKACSKVIHSLHLLTGQLHVNHVTIHILFLTETQLSLILPPIIIQTHAFAIHLIH